MNKIPTSNNFNGEIVFLRFFSKNDNSSHINQAHRDDYYIFVFVETGYVKLSIDFKEYEIKENTVHCILPRQVHFTIDYPNAKGWLLAIDPILVSDEYKDIFQKSSFMKNKVEFSESVICDLKHCISILHKRLRPGEQLTNQSIINSVVSSYIGIVAETHLNGGLPTQINRRPAIITFQFKSLLAANYRTLKTPSQYADKMNISAIYLNEVVKKTTGLTVSESIHDEIVKQAKCLLFYTNMNIKEVALELGYEDWAYFTRLFTKVSSLTPTQFREKYFK